MKTHLPRLLAICAIATLVAVPASHAQRNLGKKKGPTSKLYMAEAVGETSLQNGDKIYTARQATAFDAPGTVIETKAGAHNALVYSNGTGMFVDENTRVEIDRFVQEPFQPERNNQRLDTPLEPSISQSNVHVSQGAVGVCTSQLMSGSSMNYSTPHGNVNIRGGKVSIETTGDATYIDLLEGDITVRGSGGRDVGGQILRPGERATITPSPSGQPMISVGPIPQAAMQAADERTETACNAKKTVTFEVIDKKAEEGLDGPEETPPAAVTEEKSTETATEGTAEETPETETASTNPPENEEAGAESDQEIVARPTVPATPPTNVVVSPDRLPGT